MADTKADTPATPVGATVVDEGEWESSSAGQVRSSEEETRAMLAEVEAETPVAEADAPEVDAAEISAAEAKPAAAAAADAKPADKKRDRSIDGRIEEKKREIGRLTAEGTREATKRDLTKGEVEKLEQRREALLTDLAALEAKKIGKPAGDKPADAPVADAPAKPKWADYRDSDQYADEGAAWEAYETAKDTWLVEAAKRTTRAELAESQKKTDADRQKGAAADAARQRDQAFGQRADAARTKHPDWNEKIQTNLGEVDTTPFLDKLVFEHPDGAEMLYRLADHPDQVAELAAMAPFAKSAKPHPNAFSFYKALEAEPDPTRMLLHFADHQDEVRKILAMPPASALMALTRLSVQLEGANGSPTTTARPSLAARPIRPVAGARSTGDPAGSVADDDVNDETFDLAKYVEKENAKDRSAGRRF